MKHLPLHHNFLKPEIMKKLIEAHKALAELNGFSQKIPNRNILYLAKNDLLDMPILYLSNYIIKHKSEYYRLLQDVRIHGSWDKWILYMLEAIEQTSKDTMEMIGAIGTLMGTTKESMKLSVPKIYSKDLLEIIFSHPYTKIEFLVDELGIHRETAAKYLNKLVDEKYMILIKIKNSKYYINIELFKILQKGL